MGYSTTSQRIRRATTTSVRFTPRLAVAFAVARVRAVAALVVEVWSQVSGLKSQVSTPASVAPQTERIAAPAALVRSVPAIAPESHVHSPTSAAAMALPATIGETFRLASPRGSIAAASRTQLTLENYIVDEAGDTLVDESGDRVVGVTL